MELKERPRYKEPFYDMDGDYSYFLRLGLGNLYQLTHERWFKQVCVVTIGEMLLRWGFNIHSELEHGKGTNLELDVVSNEDRNKEIVRG